MRLGYDGVELSGDPDGYTADAVHAVEELDFEELTRGVEEVPAGSQGLLFVPHLDGRILPSAPSMRGAWIGLTRHHTRRHLVRAMLESVAYEYAGYLRVLLDLHPELRPNETRVVGGGARSGAWNAIKASVLDVPYVRLDRTELGCWGAALVAGHAVGIVDDLAETAAVASTIRQRYEPDPEDHAVYERMTEQYRHLLTVLALPFKALTHEHSPEREEVECV